MIKPIDKTKEITIYKDYIQVYDYEFNNFKHWGYTEKDSRVFRTEFEHIISIADMYFGKLHK